MIMVGTRYDSVNSKSALLEVNALIKGLLDNGVTVVENKSDNLLFFPVDNKHGKGISLVRETIEGKINVFGVCCLLFIFLTFDFLKKRHVDRILSISKVRV